MGSRSRVQRDVRLQAGLALLVGTALFAGLIYAFKKPGKSLDAATSASVSAAPSAEEAGVPTVFFGDAGSTVSVDAGGRVVTFGEPRYTRCQDPGPGKTPPERCDHLGSIEALVTKAIGERSGVCVPSLGSPQAIEFVVDVSFKRKKIVLKEHKDGSSMAPATRKHAVDCFSKGLAPATWDSIERRHQRYTFTFVATFGASSTPGGSLGGAGAPVGLPPIP